MKRRAAQPLDAAADAGKRGRSGASSTALTIAHTAPSTPSHFATGMTYQLSGHAGALLAVQFSPDGTALATAGVDRKLFLWDVTEPPQNAAAWSLPSTVCDLAWAPDNAQVATAQVNGSVGLWDVQRQTCTRTLGRLTKPVNAVGGSKHGHAQFIAGSDDGSVQVWDARARRPAAVLRHTAEPLKSRKSALSMPVLSVACNADASSAWAGTLDGRVWQWDVRSAAEPVHVMAAHSDMVTGLALARDAERVSSLSADGTVRVWDIRPFVPAEAANAADRGHPRCAALLKGAVAGAGAHLHRVAWNPQDTQVLAAGDDGCVQVWDVDSGVPLASVPGHAGAVTGIATHAAGSWLATCSVDGSAVLGKLC